MGTASRFRAAYAEHREAEGRGKGGEAELLALPYPTPGPLARLWAVRARTYQKFLGLVARHAREVGRPLRVLDLGAGNGWLCYRLGLLDHRAVALDWRVDRIDGLGAAAGYQKHVERMFPRVGASFQEIPFAGGRFDFVVFNAALHYSVNLEQTLREAARVTTPGGRLVILDSPFYADEQDGNSMVAEKRHAMRQDHPERAKDLLDLPSIEFLTSDRLHAASAFRGLRWRRHRVRYPLWYEMRGLVARFRRRRAPSRFDLWEATVA